MGTHVSVSYFIKHFSQCSTGEKPILTLPHLLWEPGWWYSQAGDCIHIYWDRESHYGKWLNPAITLYLSDKTNTPVGVFIQGISKEFKEHVSERDT